MDALIVGWLDKWLIGWMMDGLLFGWFDEWINNSITGWADG